MVLRVWVTGTTRALVLREDETKEVGKTLSRLWVRFTGEDVLTCHEFYLFFYFLPSLLHYIYYVLEIGKYR